MSRRSCWCGASAAGWAAGRDTAPDPARPMTRDAERNRARRLARAIVMGSLPRGESGTAWPSVWAESVALPLVRGAVLEEGDGRPRPLAIEARPARAARAPAGRPHVPGTAHPLRRHQPEPLLRPGRPSLRLAGQSLLAAPRRGGPRAG